MVRDIGLRLRRGFLLVPATIVSAAGGLVSSMGLGKTTPNVLPIPAGLAVGLAAFGYILLQFLPWAVIFTLFAATGIASRLGALVGGVAVRAADIFIVPLFLRVFLLSSRKTRPAWRWPEWSLIAFVFVQFATSLLNAADKAQSIGSAGLLAIGMLSYLSTYTAVSTRERLIFAARVVLVILAGAGAVAIVAELLHLLVGSMWLMGNLPGTGPVVRGLSFEPDILGSTEGGGAMAFLILIREDNPIFTRGRAWLGFWLCLGAMLASLSRGALVGFLAAWVVALVLRRRPDRGPAIRLWRIMPTLSLVMVAALGVLVLSALPTVNLAKTPIGFVQSEVSKKASDIFSSRGTASARLQEDLLALKQSENTLLLGKGTNSFGQRNLSYVTDPPQPAYIGNLYIRTLYDSGVVGLVLLLLFMLSVAWPSRFLQFTESEFAPVARAFIFAYAAMAVAYASTDASFEVWPWIIAGLAVAARRLARLDDRALRAGGAVPEPAAAAAGGVR